MRVWLFSHIILKKSKEPFLRMQARDGLGKGLAVKLCTGDTSSVVDNYPVKSHGNLWVMKL